MNIKGIIFDKDGTLIDYHRTWMPINHRAALEAANHDKILAKKLMLESGWQPKTDTIAAGSLLAVNTNREIAEVWANYVIDKTADDLTNLLNQVFTREGIISAIQVTDLKPFLIQLRQLELRLGIATSDSHSGTHAMLKHFDIGDLFDFVSGFDSGYGVKPDPCIVRNFCQVTGVSEAEIMMVGDNLHDIELGRNAGVGYCIGVLTGTSDRKVLASHADFVLKDITEIPYLLDQIN